jgi:hypothetical protein
MLTFTRDSQKKKRVISTRGALVPRRTGELALSAWGWLPARWRSEAWTDPRVIFPGKLAAQCRAALAMSQVSGSHLEKGNSAVYS